MNNFEKDFLKNSIEVITRNNHNTPRASIQVFIKSPLNSNDKVGLSQIAGRLLVQGTENAQRKKLHYKWIQMP